MVDEVLHAGVLQPDRVHQAGRGFQQPLAGVAGLAVEREPLARDAAEYPQILNARILRPEAEGARSRNDRPGQRAASQIDPQINVRSLSQGQTPPLR